MILQGPRIKWLQLLNVPSNFAFLLLLIMIREMIRESNYPQMQKHGIRCLRALRPDPDDVGSWFEARVAAAKVHDHSDEGGEKEGLKRINKSSSCSIIRTAVCHEFSGVKSETSLHSRDDVQIKAILGK